MGHVVSYVVPCQRQVDQSGLVSILETDPHLFGTGDDDLAQLVQRRNALGACRTARNQQHRICSTGPLRSFGVADAVPHRAAPAAATASIESDFPNRRRNHTTKKRAARKRRGGS